MSFQDPRYRYPIGSIDTLGTDTLFVFFIKQIPEANLSTDTQGEYRYPKGGIDTLRGGTDTLVSFKLWVESFEGCNGCLLSLEKGKKFKSEFVKSLVGKLR
ncbi:hypothetical protein GQ457_13G021750 [Hibiscus cannabinus]